jgi:hypothetical protein
MTEKKLTGNKMFEMVKEECERILGKVEEEGVLYERKVNGEWGWYKRGNEKKDLKYVGEIEDGKPNGQGTLTTHDGGKYVGEWKNGEYDGQGTETFPDGIKYVGEFKDDERNGQGTLTFPDGERFVGEYKDGRFWNVTVYDKNGNIEWKIVKGKWIIQ